ncbi:hypothetical protein T459_09037 [Capsicum annuum]|uniref:Uncharacterized protein n=1 Tax=Capsicum annuum TaxID=4072 RepID=A0A2G2ZYA4_CAPAN|nr:hypothetical protein T459_09037 [Capsicum annuum]
MEAGAINPMFEFEKLQIERGNSLYPPVFSSLGQMSSLPEKEVLPYVDNEIESPKDEFSDEGPTKVYLEGKLQEILRSDSLMVQLQEPEKTIKILEKKACSLDKELEDQNKFNEKLNSTCNFLHLQQESVDGSVKQPEKSPLTNESTHSRNEAVSGSQPIVPSKKRIVLGLWRKLLRKDKRNSSMTKLKGVGLMLLHLTAQLKVNFVRPFESILKL